MGAGRAWDRWKGPVFYRGLRALGLPAVSRRVRDAGLIVCYHNVVSDEGPPQGEPGLHLSRERFAEQMRWLAGRYAVVTLGEFADRLAAGGPMRAVAAVTFDDGYTGVFEHAVPILRALRIPATVFLVAEAAEGRAAFWWDRPEIVASATPARRERWLGELQGDARAIVCRGAPAAGEGLPASYRPALWSTIRAHLGDGIGIGVHSATHRSLPTLGGADLEYEVVGSRTIVQRALGVTCEFFAYPYGRWDARVRALVKAAGYRAGLSLDVGLNAPPADPWCLRRVNVPAGITGPAFEAWTAGLRAPARA
ncbi:MAG TPA: polysaccharide deacetylase family protein [Vicinamibacteria bacterium]|nr:polysaccharide deacetylase family protein [Vicinamibacteria bacterium]